MNTAVITGPTGAIGLALCDNLLSHGYTVYAVVRPASPRAARLPDHPKLKVVECDLGKLEALTESIPHADAWFHLGWSATIGPGRNDMLAQTENIRATVTAVQTAAKLGCQVFVGSGSQAEYGRIEGKITPDAPTNPENGYGMAKLCAGQMSRMECEKLGLRHEWARVLSVYGPGDGPRTLISIAIHGLLAGEKPAFTAGEQMWDYLYSGDAADAFRLMAEKGRHGAIYPVGSGEARPLKEYLMLLRDAIDPTLPLGLGEIPYGDKQVMFLQADRTALTEDTGFVPKTDFETGIRATIQFVKDAKQ